MHYDSFLQMHVGTNTCATCQANQTNLRTNKLVRQHLWNEEYTSFQTKSQFTNLLNDSSQHKLSESMQRIKCAISKLHTTIYTAMHTVGSSSRVKYPFNYATRNKCF